MRILIFINVLLACSFSDPARCQSNSSSDRNEVYKVVELIGDAWSQNNLDTLGKYIHEDYEHTDVRGQILDRTTWLNYVKDRKEKNVSNPKIGFEDVQIKIYDDFAFVTGINIFTGQAYTGTVSNSSKPSKIRFTQVLKKNNKIWKRIIFQATYIEP